MRDISKELNKGFILNLLELAEIAADADGDTIDFTLAERDGIRMNVSISFSYISIDKEDN
jgi:hypothetical protein